MKCMKVCLMVALAIVFNLQTQASGQTTTSGRKVIEITQPLVPTTLRNSKPTIKSAVTVGAPYTIVPGIGTELDDGTAGGFFFGIQADPATTVVNDGIMDGDADVIGVDFADIFGLPAANPVVAHECLEFVGMDPAGSGRFLMRLTVSAEATGTAMEWDTLSIDNQDPTDADMDGETGKGPDGIYFTPDDIFVTDGIFDTGDGMLNAAFPLDPPGLADGAGDELVRTGLFIGANAGGNPIVFDPASGPVTVTSALWQCLDANGDLADIFGDGLPDGPFDLIGFAAFTAAADGGWDGSLGVGFGTDGVACSTNDSLNGNVRTNQLVVEYLSDIMPPLFCFAGSGPMGCESPSAFTRFRGVDVGGPSGVGDFADVDGTAGLFNPGFTLNDLEAPVWLIFDYAATGSGEVQVTSNAGTPGLTMTVEYADAAGSFGAIDSQSLGTAAESFNSFTTETFSLAGITTDRIRVGWRQTGFIINFPWEVRVDSVGLCQ